jgi:curved DNA-binding protein CbpA
MPSDAVPVPDPYKILQVDPEAEDEVIQAAYRRLAQKYHPDRAAGDDASARMVAINAAWELIRTPERRIAYDRSRQELPPYPAADQSTRPRASARAPEEVSRDWTTGRSDAGHAYDDSMRSPDGYAAAGMPPGNPSGTVLAFGRYAGWSLGEIARTDLDYIEWLDRMPIGRAYRDEIDAILRRAGLRRSAASEANNRRGLFRRR